MGYKIGHMERSEYVVFEPAWRLIGAVLEDRCRFSDVGPFLRHLRFKRIFAAPFGSDVGWFTEASSPLGGVTDGYQWLLGSPCIESSISRASPSIAGQTGFGASGELRSQRLLICANPRLMPAIAQLDFPHIHKSIWDVQGAWRAHRHQIERYLPAFGNECEGVFREGSEAYAAISACISAAPETYLGYLQKLTHALLLFVGIKAHRGELH